MGFLDTRRLIVTADGAELARTVADRIMSAIAANAGRIAICLAGGSSPKQLYELLATPSYSERIPWQRTHWFIGDERFVPPDDPLHNMAMARQALLDRAAPPENIHAIPTDGASPDDSAARYEGELKAFYGAEQFDPARPLFDIVLLGVGPDGHTASLFPNAPALHETQRWVTGVAKANVAPFVPRVTLTLPTLGSCREMLFEAAGSGKRAILTRLFDGEDLPAGRALSNGETLWLVDEAAAPENFRGK